MCNKAPRPRLGARNNQGAQRRAALDARDPAHGQEGSLVRAGGPPAR